MKANIISFGFKHNKEISTDILFDVRFLPNPYYQPTLKERTGLDKETSSYAIDNEQGTEFFNNLEPLLIFLYKQYKNTGRDAFTIAIGCTGGKHRSVAVVERISKMLSKVHIETLVTHRDLHLD